MEDEKTIKTYICSGRVYRGYLLEKTETHYFVLDLKTKNTIELPISGTAIENENTSQRRFE